ncbi:MAG: hypothetical protein MUD16_06960 [Desulfobacterales bacterium]|nr:hypothetical protein [Desulfobacterales bacterium]
MAIAKWKRFNPVILASGIYTWQKSLTAVNAPENTIRAIETSRSRPDFVNRKSCPAPQEIIENGIGRKRRRRCRPDIGSQRSGSVTQNQLLLD